MTNRVSRRDVIGGVGAGAMTLAISRSAAAAKMSPDWRTAFPKTAAVAAGHAGQIYVARAGTALIDAGVGELPVGSPIRADTLVSWASAVKPTTCAALMKLVETDRVGLDDPVTKFIPEFAVNGKGDVKIRHLLNHSAHLGGYDGPMRLPPFEETVARIIAAPRETARGAIGVPTGTVPAPGTVPAYNPAGIWIIGEILQRLHQRPFADVMQREIYGPCGMLDSSNGLSAERRATYGQRAAALGAGPLAFRGGPGSTLSRGATGPLPVNPAGGGIGPSHDLARFYDMMLAGGSIGGRRILKPETVRQMTTLTLSDGKLWAWGLGLNLNVVAGARSGQRFGNRASSKAFGHAGASGIVAFADPEAKLVIVAIPAGPVLDTVYDDLKLA